jgi:hypothetical protein
MPVASATASVEDCAPGNPLTPQAEMFATNNTETIADPADALAAQETVYSVCRSDGTTVAARPRSVALVKSSMSK